MLSEATYKNLSSPKPSKKTMSQNKQGMQNPLVMEATFSGEGQQKSIEKPQRGRPRKSGIGSIRSSPRSNSTPAGMTELTRDEESPVGKKRKAGDRNCKICDKLVPGIEDAIACKACSEPVCLTCANVDVSVLRVIMAGSIPGMAWMCAPCTKFGMPTLSELSNTLKTLSSTSQAQWTSVDKRMSSMHATIDETLDKKMTDMQAAIIGELDERFAGRKEEIKQEVEENVMKQVNEKIDKKFEEDTEEMKVKLRTEIVKEMEEDQIKKMHSKMEAEHKNMEARLIDEITVKVREELEQKLKNTPTAQPPAGNRHSPGTQINLTVKEMEERERKKNNIIVHGLPEPKTNSREERSNSDKDKIKDLINNTLEVHCPPDMITETIRLGKSTPEKSKRPRPVLTILKTAEKKQEIFKNLGKLKGSRYKNISLNDDMTQLERQQLKKMIDQAKELEKKEGKGRWIYRVRGPPWDRKIIKIEISKETPIVGPSKAREDGETEMELGEEGKERE